jgi:hypothetical protein
MLILNRTKKKRLNTLANNMATRTPPPSRKVMRILEDQIGDQHFFFMLAAQ